MCPLMQQAMVACCCYDILASVHGCPCSQQAMSACCWHSLLATAHACSKPGLHAAGSSPWLPAATDKISVIFFAVEVNLACLWAKHSWLFDMVSTPQPTGRGLSLALFEFFGSLVFWPDSGPYLTISLLTPYMILFLDGLESFFGFIFFPICWRIYKDGQVIPLDDSLDYGANFSHMLGFDSPKMLELMRLYVTIHRFVCVCVCDVLMKNKKKIYNGRETSCTHS